MQALANSTFSCCSAWYFSEVIGGGTSFIRALRNDRVFARHDEGVAGEAGAVRSWPASERAAEEQAEGQAAKARFSMLAIMYHETHAEGHRNAGAGRGRLATCGLRRRDDVTPAASRMPRPPAGVYYVPSDETEA